MTSPDEFPHKVSIQTLPITTGVDEGVSTTGARRGSGGRTAAVAGSSRSGDVGGGGGGFITTAIIRDEGNTYGCATLQRGVQNPAISLFRAHQNDPAIRILQITLIPKDPNLSRSATEDLLIDTLAQTTRDLARLQSCFQDAVRNAYLSEPQMVCQ